MAPQSRRLTAPRHPRGLTHWPDDVGRGQVREHAGDSHCRYPHKVNFDALLPQIIVAVASLGGVLIGLLINGHRDNKRFTKQLAFERERILADERRLLFIKAAHACQRMREHLKRRHEQLHDGRPNWKKKMTQAAHNLFIIETELRLLAPDVVPFIYQAARHARSVRDADPATPESELRPLVNAYRAETGDAMRTMQEILGTQPTPQPQRDKTPLDKPGKKSPG